MSRQSNWVPGQPHDESRLDAVLRRLAHESPKEAPLSVRQHLQSIIQQHRPVEPARVDRWLRPVLGIAALVLVAVAGVLVVHAISNRRAQNHQISRVRSVSNRSVEPPPGIEIQKPSAISPSQTVKRHHRPLPVRHERPAFVALPFSDPTLTNGTNVTIRMTFSDAELLALGIAPDENKRRQYYVADVVLGDDGLPRAIRVLPNISGIQGGS